MSELQSTSDHVVQSKAPKKRSVGTYVPPAKRVKKEKFDEGSEEHQREAWDDNKKKINGLINRANTSNVTAIVKELFKCNLIRYKGLFALSLVKAQEASPSFTDVYAALLAVINSRIKSIGILVINRLILQFRNSLSGNNKSRCLTSINFLAHLINQDVLCDAIAFELINDLMSKPDPTSIEVVIAFIKECGAKLDQMSSTRMFEVFRYLRDLSLEKDFDTRTHDMIDLIHDIKKDKFRNHPSVKPDLDILDEKDKITHELRLDQPTKDDYHMEHNYFKYDPKWKVNESKYEEFKKSLLDDASDSESDEDETGSTDSADSEGDARAVPELKDEKIKIEPGQDCKPDVKPSQKVIDATGGDMIAFRRKIYLTIRSSVESDEVVHKLLKARIDPVLNEELCQMILDCCGQERVYEEIYGRIAAKLCQIYRREFPSIFQRLFQNVYDSAHRLETNKIKIISKFYGHLLAMEAVEWDLLGCLKLRENATTSAGRCLIVFLFRELRDRLSIKTLIEYTKDPAKQSAFKDLFPMDEEQDIRFAINFFTCSGLGQLTDDLRQELLSRQ